MSEASALGMTASWLARRERPKLANAASPGAPTVGAVLVKGMPFPAACALPWTIWDALHPKIYH